MSNSDSDRQTPFFSASNAQAKDSAWEHDLIERLAEASLKEQRRARRWGIFFKLLMFGYLFAILALYLPIDWDTGTVGGADHTALIDLDGVIASDTQASADRIVTGLRNAFEDEHTKGVILRINSPGGSPVQSAYINSEITRLRGKYPDIKLYAVVTDLCASGGYYIAAAADEIYVHESSIIGSIGVVMNGFGFVETMQKLGIERRMLTAGKSKGLLDPFSPTKPDEVAHIKTLLNDIHQQFIATVRKGRGDRLKGSDEELFNGLVWTGAEGIKLGLADKIGSSSYVAREVIGVEEIKNFTVRENYIDRLAKRFGAGMASSLGAIFGSSGAELR